MPNQSFHLAPAPLRWGHHPFWLVFGFLALLLGPACSDSSGGGVPVPEAGADGAGGAKVDVATPSDDGRDAAVGTDLGGSAETSEGGIDVGGESDVDAVPADAPSVDLATDTSGPVLDATSADAYDLGHAADAPADVLVTIPDAARDELAALDTPSDSVSTPDLSGTPADADVRPAGGYLTVVAHPDDDIIFFNPDLASFMRQGVPASIVYLTSGDQSEQERGWKSRERGILDAEAAMAGLTSRCATQDEDPTAPCPWSCAAASYRAHSVWQCKLQAFTAIFLRLPDGQIGALWGPPAYDSAVESLSQIADAGGTSSYTRQELIDVLAEIMARLAPAQILAMDSTMAYNSDEGEGGYDHPDHMSAGFFALAASHAYRGHRQFRIYRGYTAVTEPENVTGAVFEEKQRLMNAYAPSGYPDCVSTYPTFCSHQISYSSITGTSALTSGGKCLRHSGSAIAMAACSGTTNESWAIAGDGRVLANDGQCLTAPSADSPVTLAACSDALATQRWTWFEPSNGQLRGHLGGCLTTDNDSAVLTDCRALPQGGVEPRQQWRAP